MIELISKRLLTHKRFGEVNDLLDRREPLVLSGISGSLMAFTLASVFRTRARQILLVVADENRAEQLRDDCTLLLGEESVRLLGRSTEHHGKMLDMSSPVAQLETLKALREDRPVVAVASAGSLACSLSDPKTFGERNIEISANTETPFQPLIEQLESLGFERKEFVEEYGDFAVRGGIIDVFSFVGDHPLRLEFWGDSLESIREFDALSQRSIRTLTTASIVARLQDETTDGSDVRRSSVFDFLRSDALVLFDEPALIEKEILELHTEGTPHLHTWEELQEQAKRFYTIQHTNFVSAGTEGTVVDFDSVAAPPTNGAVKILVQQIADLNERGIEVFIACDSKRESDRIKELIEEEQTAPERLPRSKTVSMRNDEDDSLDESGDVVDEDREDERDDDDDAPEARSSADVPETDIAYTLLSDAIHSGFVFPDASIAVFTEHEIFGRLKRHGSGKRARFKGLTQKEFSQLKRGDFVVHVDYGIGRFDRLQKIKVRGVEAEVMKLSYADGDSIYVNLNFVNRVQKYSSQEGHAPQLTKLGSPDWERLKSKARKKVKDIARDLIRLYAKRKHEQGFAFQPDAHWQKEMEASFMYEDTPDQATTSADVKRDMESPAPMDRLVCGDVGFGKTEIAVRAAFKAVLNGKQAAVLVPTTILAQQHFNTFVDRMGRYGVRVESLSRFRTAKEQKAVVAGLKEGKVDVVIGTHRILSKDVIFKDLGLLIIDEEHRFGVTAKEKLRQIRATIDTLTLTATPIPRTLQFSLMGARDLSIISTPPRNRMPIMTEIVQYDLGIAREAILKELHRGGQVYFIHDRINDMDEVEALLRDRIPEARFRSAHGQMAAHELESVMMDFMEKKFDVLLCTKIIESGIDIPSVNTIVINRADRFGLAELYQLRGRVGRSNVQAYAYLLTPPLVSMPKQTLRRLQAIQEFTELGSGFNLAMRDMEIRGAGNLLGAEQSGFILEMGYEMYQRIVEEAVAELKEEEFKDLVDRTAAAKSRVTECVVETDVEALIPDLYIESDAERLEIYRRLYQSETTESLQEMRAELGDRFGEYPEEVENLFRTVELKLSASRLHLTRLELSGTEISFTLPGSDDPMFYQPGDTVPSPFQQLMDRSNDLKQYKLNLKQEGKTLRLVGRIPASDVPQERLFAAGKLLWLLKPTM